MISKVLIRYWNSWQWLVPVFLLLLMAAVPVRATGTNDTVSNKKETSFPVLKPVGFLQQHVTLDNIEENPVHFSTHRARFGFAGAFSENIKLNLIIGAVEPPERKPALVNAFADFNIHPLFNLRTGQFLVPFGIEGPEPITQNPAIERSVASRRMNHYRIFRDIGLMAQGQ